MALPCRRIPQPRRSVEPAGWARGTTGRWKAEEGGWRPTWVLTRVRGRSEEDRGTPQRGGLPPSPLDGMLYSGTMNNFLGSEPILIRTLGPQPVLKTDNFLRWLQRKDTSPQHRSGPAPSVETRPREPRFPHSAVLGAEPALCQAALVGAGGAVPAPVKRQDQAPPGPPRASRGASRRAACRCRTSPRVSQP